MSGTRQRLVVVGNGMVGHRFVARLVAATGEAGADGFDVTVLGEEPRPAYDRVNLSKFFEGEDGTGLTLVEPGFYEQAGVRLVLGDAVATVDRGAKVPVVPASARPIAASYSPVGNNA